MFEWPWIGHGFRPFVQDLDDGFAAGAGFSFWVVENHGISSEFIGFNCLTLKK